jgi:Zn-dependent protease
MNGSWHLGKFSGIDVRIHWTFLLLPTWIYVSNLAAGTGAVAATVAVLFILAIFACVLLHEMGHALMARRFGIPTHDITLLPIGGLASLQRMPRQPWQELAIAVAGPAVNVIIASAIFVGMLLIDPIAGPASSFVTQLAIVNVILVVFNMLPAFPMDGGRVLRSVLAMTMPYASATRIAANVGQVTAIGFGLLGLLSGNLMLVLIAGFIILAARGEAMRVANEVPHDNHSTDTVQTQLLTQPALSDSNIRSLPVISAQWNARNALGWLGRDSLEEFLVSSGGSVIGVLRKSDLQKAVGDGRGALAIERLLAFGMLQMRSLRSV